MIVEQITVGMMAVCCYVVGCEKTKKCVVIDPGGDDAKVLAVVKKHGLTVELIINTHGHPDHVCGNGGIKKATGAGIAMHEADVEFFARRDIIQYFSVLNLPASPPVDRRLKDNESIAIGEIAIKVIHTPGHTPGGVCLYAAPHLFTGDTMFVGGVGRTDFPGGDTRQLLGSIKGRLYHLPDETVVWPGHGYGGDRSTLGEEKKENPFLAGGGW